MRSKEQNAIEKQLYMIVRQISFTKGSNGMCLVIAAGILVFLAIGTAPHDLMNAQWQHNWSIIYILIIVSLILSRLFWNWYEHSAVSGICEVIATYLNSLMIIFMMGNIFNIGNIGSFITALACLAFFIIWFFVGVWYEIRGIKFKKIMVYMIYSIIIIGVVGVVLYLITWTRLFMGIDFIMMGFLISTHVVPYFFVLNFPYKKRLYKKFEQMENGTPFGIKILPSSVFANKKDKHSKK